MKQLPRTVVALGVASLFTDLSSEMIYPLLPLFLTTVLGAGPLALGAIEGVAESASALLKVISGVWTDRTSRRKPFILAGYGLAGVVRPLIGLATSWPFVLAMRLVDRVGKGLRTSPRDVLIADVTDLSQRGTAFGFHRSMDHAGAVVGPLVAVALLAQGVSLRHVFLLAAIPAAAVMVVLAAAVKEPRTRERMSSSEAKWSGHWRDLGRDFKLLLLAVLVFTLGNSSDTFLLLRLSAAGVPVTWIAGLWSLHHVVKMVASYLGGSFSDRLGRRKLVLSGWFAYALVYLAFAMADSRPALIAVFIAYGVYFGLTEPTERAWVADLAPQRLRGTAFGYYHSVVGLGALPASLIFGLVWQAWGAPAAFLMGAALATGASGLLLLVGRRQ